jgi:hypothetical protein
MYKVIECDTAAQLAREVQTGIEQGLFPLGGVSVTIVEGELVYCQAMVSPVVTFRPNAGIQRRD